MTPSTQPPLQAAGDTAVAEKASSNGLVVVADCILVLVKFLVRVSPFKICVGVVGIHSDSPGVLTHSHDPKLMFASRLNREPLDARVATKIIGNADWDSSNSDLGNIHCLIQSC
jgi:hypothetical protein